MSYDTNNAFARILRGEIPCIKIAETDAALAIMDIMPQAEGHVLIIPKAPAVEIFDLPDEALSAAMTLARRVARALRAALRPDGLFVGQFNGAAAGQTVPHVHVHLIPRWSGVEMKLHAREMADPAALEATAQKIRAALADA